VLYRRTDGDAWQPVDAGLPDPKGTRAFVLATQRAEPGVFYAATRRDLYRSSDAGQHWQTLAIDWPDQARFNTVNAMAVAS
jgi:hypothetical protein